LDFRHAPDRRGATVSTRTASLRTAARDGRLSITVIAGKHLTTKAALKELSVCSTL
jgi:hypothetical protein